MQKYFSHSIVGLFGAAVLLFIGSGYYTIFTTPPDRVLAERDMDGDGISDRVVEKSYTEFYGPYVYNYPRIENHYGAIINNEKVFVPEHILDQYKE